MTTKQPSRGLLPRYANKLADAIFKITGNKESVLDLMKQPSVLLEVEKVADRLHRQDWERNVVSGYRAKIAKVKRGVGKHSLKGIPLWFLQQHGMSQLA